jgi:hypothetical protein
MRRRSARPTGRHGTLSGDGGHEEDHVDCRAAVGGVAGHSASRYIERPVTAGRSSANSTVAGPDDRGYLHRGSHRDVLQCYHRPEREWLPIKRWTGIKHADTVHPALRCRMAGQRTVQLTKLRFVDGPGRGAGRHGAIQYLWS